MLDFTVEVTVKLVINLHTAHIGKPVSCLKTNITKIYKLEDKIAIFKVSLYVAHTRLISESRQSVRTPIKLAYLTIQQAGVTFCIKIVFVCYQNKA